MMEFHKAMKEAYGEKYKGKMDIDTDEVEKAEVKIDGDKATLKMPDQRAGMDLVKKDGAWKIDPGEKLSKDPDKSIKMMKAQVEAYEAVMDDIGKEGETAESIGKKLMQAQMKAMGMGEMPKPEMPTLPE
jgi:hypothetical protein